MAKSSSDRRAEFRATDAVVSVVALVLLAALLGPALAQSRNDSALNLCLRNTKEIAIAIANFESARRTLPLASTQPITGKPADAAAPDPAGYSWLVMTLPMLERDNGPALFDKLNSASDSLRKLPFDPAVTAKDGSGNLLSRDTVISTYLCPTYLASLNGPVDASGKPAAANAAKRPAISNYHALAGTHFFNKEGLGRMVPLESLLKQADGRIVATTPFEGNGALPFPGVQGGTVNRRGVRVSQVSDGMSQTIMFAETVESKFASWLDGQVTWLVAAWPGSAEMPGQLPAVGTFPPFVGWTAEQLPKNFTSLGKQWSPDAPEPTPPYLAADRWSGGQNRVWGPSSYHGKVVMHAFVDCHAQVVSVDVDKNTYLQLVTRSGREVISDEKYRVE